ncbi:hypothetical protein [Polaromonas sp.]|uniref:hypothetical protein n=1 Tax=Polaromonas sp. TaxID=1869339 RepID=UPI00352AEAB2
MAIDRIPVAAGVKLSPAAGGFLPRKPVPMVFGVPISLGKGDGVGGGKIQKKAAPCLAAWVVEGPLQERTYANFVCVLALPAAKTGPFSNRCYNEKWPSST